MRETAETFTQQTHQELKPGTHVEVLTKQQHDGRNLRGTIISAAPNTTDTYVVEYHPGLDNGHHSGDELRVIPTLEDKPES